MAFEEIAGIAAAEAEAKRIVAEAAAEAKRILAEAEDAGKAEVEEASGKARTEILEMKNAAQTQAEAAARDIYSAAENKKAVLRAKAESQCAKAVKLVAERIVNG